MWIVDAMNRNLFCDFLLPRHTHPYTKSPKSDTPPLSLCK